MTSETKAEAIYWVGVAACAVTSWLAFREFCERANMVIVPMIGSVLAGRPFAGVWAAGVGAVLFALIGRTVRTGVPVIPRSSTVFLGILTFLWALHVWGQVSAARAEYYRLHVVQSLYSLATEVMILAAIWGLWVFARRAPSLARRVVFSLSMAVYATTIWRGSVVWLEGF